MDKKFEYQVFLSHSHEDIAKARSIYETMLNHRLHVFFSERNLSTGKEFAPEIIAALAHSQHLVVYCSPSSVKSRYVQQEWETFLEYQSSDPENRFIHVLVDEACNEADIPKPLQGFQRPNSVDHLIIGLFRSMFENSEAEKSDFKSKLVQERQKVAEAQAYYQRNRFWGPISKNGDVHIFTCGRDTEAESARDLRGQGGRTNIDMWDYRAVLDIAHFFLSSYPNAKVTIEDPKAKLRGSALETVGLLVSSMTDLQRTLTNKDCIIIGSPDVSDFAEIGLAQIHKIPPYDTERIKSKGFVIIKDSKITKSSFYWERKDSEPEGVAEILSNNQYNYFANEPVIDDGKPGKMYGILTVATNPFYDGEFHRKLIILSGFSGVATNAIAKILTSEEYLSEFYKLDNNYTNTRRDIEALIGVEYVAEKGMGIRDTRRILDITFEKLVEI